jgi:hypothetical protein
MQQRDVAALGQNITSHTLQLRAGPRIVTAIYTIVTEPQKLRSHPGRIGPSGDCARISQILTNLHTAIVAVANTGPPIPAIHRERIFAAPGGSRRRQRRSRTRTPSRSGGDVALLSARPSIVARGVGR